MVTNQWSLAFGKVRKVVQPCLGSNRPNYSGLQYHGDSIAGIPFACRPSAQHTTYKAGNALRTFKPKANLSLPNVSITYESQIAWKTHSMTYSCKGFASLLVRKAGYSSIASSRASYFRVQEYGRHSISGFFLGCRTVLHHKLFMGRNASFMAYRGNEKLHRGIHVKNFSTANGSAASQSQLAWKRLSKACSYRGFVSPTVNKITCAMSLAFARFHMVPSVLALIGGELACSKIAWAEGEYFPKGNNLYTRAQDGHIYITSLILSVLEFFILLLRAIYLTLLFSPAMVTAPFADTLGTQYRKIWLQLVHQTLEKAGPAFIKWGQWAATRPDLFPADLCTELSKLHSKAPEHSFAYTKKTIEKAFGRKISDIFEDFEEEPVASGSVAQIHRASLRFRYPGQRMKRVVVAVKVRHPGVSESIRRDFVIINTVAKISKFIPTLKWLRLDESVQQFAVFMMSQVDLAREAAHLSRFIYNFRSWKDVSFPKPLYPLVHPAVLVETYEQGESVSHYVDELGGNDRLKSALAHIGTHALLKMLLEVEKSFAFWGTREGDIVHPAECMHQLLEQVRRHKVNVDGNVCTVMVTTLVLEGWQRKLDPDYDVMQTLQALLFKSDWAVSLKYTIEGLMAP